MLDTTNVLNCRDLVVGYGDNIIVDGVSLHVSAGEMLAVVGPNGAGKSTLIKAVAGLLKPKSGQVSLGGENITANSPHLRARNGIAYVPQLNNVFQDLTVAENLRLGVQHISMRARVAKVNEAMEWFPELGKLKAHRAGDLSGGQRQMLTISRALLLGPRLLVVDEPTAGLSPLISQQVFDTLVRIRSEGTAVLVVEQDVDLALTSADRVLVLATGEKVFEGTPAELLKDDRLVGLYLGG